MGIFTQALPKDRWRLSSGKLLACLAPFISKALAHITAAPLQALDLLGWAAPRLQSCHAAPLSVVSAWKPWFRIL